MGRLLRQLWVTSLPERGCIGSRQRTSEVLQLDTFCTRRLSCVRWWLSLGHTIDINLIRLVKSRDLPFFHFIFSFFGFFWSLMSMSSLDFFGRVRNPHVGWNPEDEVKVYPHSRGGVDHEVDFSNGRWTFRLHTVHPIRKTCLFGFSCRGQGSTFSKLFWRGVTLFWRDTTCGTHPSPNKSTPGTESRI